MNLQQCLKILELDTIGSLQGAKRAYMDLVRVWHPDRFQSNPRLKQKADKKLREINLAYNYLRSYIESNQAGELSTIRVASPNSPSGLDAVNYAHQSGSHRPGMNSRAMVGDKNPDTARLAVPVTRAVQRSSSIGRYVLLAFLCVFVAISALVVYFLPNTDKIASKTRGMASEVMEKIVDKLEKNEAIQKNDPSVQGIIQEMDRATKSAESEKKFEIHLDSGSIIMTEAWWEESDMIMYRVDGGSMGIERSRVKKIVKPGKQF
ncbi:J domain-containing protein [Thermodesulfobacteriota bacterium]